MNAGTYLVVLRSTLAAVTRTADSGSGSMILDLITHALVNAAVVGGFCGRTAIVWR